MVVSTDAKTLVLRFKWMKIRDHAEEIKRISAFGFKHPLFPDFFHGIKEDDCIACLAIEDEADGNGFIGYVVYKWSESWIYILDLAIVPEFESFDLLFKIIKKIIERTKERRREFIFVDARESNCGLLSAMKRNGFRAVRIIWNFFCDEDAYRMVYSPKSREFLIEEIGKEIDEQLAN